ncbi:MAG: Hsp70 family protein, partial [Alphaproteobacteria bacterium]|nr:Hsp70 family protein [Alphaproteobacteria bacterium]
MYIGIDLGTSNSSIAGIIDGMVRVFRPADGGEVLPSIIYFDKRGHRLYGRRAHDQALVTPENVAAGFKRLMGTSTPIEIKGVELTLTPEECSAEIIRQLMGEAATETNGEKITGAVVTIPASFNQMQTEATLRAAKMAGLDRVDLLQEPIAAALAAMQGSKRSGRFLIYDLGGGTFDVALAQAIEGEVKILAHQGINMLGGRDFDRMIVNEVVRPWLASTFDLPENFQRDPAYRRLIRIATLAAEKAKIDLSSQEEASILASDEELRMTDQNEMEMYLDVPFQRTRFEEMIRPSIMRTIDLVRTILSENNTSNDEIDRIVFIGGPSRIPLVRQLVPAELGIAADLNIDPMTAVAIGAAYYCEGRQWNASNVSEPKPTQAEAKVPEEPRVTYSYTARTPNDKTVVTVHVTGNVSEDRQVKLATDKWDS